MARITGTEHCCDKWKKHEFSSGGYAGPDYHEFMKDFKKAVKEQIKPFGVNLHFLHKNHYDGSGMFEKNGKFIYFSISDIRFFKNAWMNNILIRTAAHDKDWTGGMNQYTDIFNLGANVNRIFDGGSSAGQYHW